MKDKFNPYGIVRDYECKTCFYEAYEADIVDYLKVDVRLSYKLKYENETVDYVSIDFHPVCPKCGDCNMKVIMKSYIDDPPEEGYIWSFGMSWRSLGFFSMNYFYIN